MNTHTTDDNTTTLATPLDSWLRNGFDRLVEGADESDVQQARGEFTHIANDVRAIHAERNAITTSRELTSDGKAARLHQLKQKALQVAHSWEPVAKKLERLPKDIRAVEDAADGGLVPDGSYGYVKRVDGPPSVEAIARGREIRDQLRGMTRQDVEMLYLNAVRTGNDPELVTAIEKAPISFPLIQMHTRRAGRELRIQQSPFAARLKALRALHATYDQMLSAAHRALFE